MRSILLCLAICANCFALEVPAKVSQREVIVIENDHVEVKYSPGCFLLVDPMDSTELTLNAQASRGDREWVWHFWGAPGRYRVRELDPQSLGVQERICEIVAGDDKPEPEPEPQPDPPTPPPTPPEPFPDTSFDIGPQVASEARRLRDSGSVTDDDLRRLAAIYRKYQHGLEADNWPTVQAAIDALGGDLASFEPPVESVIKVYRERMRAAWEAGTMRTAIEHAGALREVADWLVGREEDLTLKQYLGAPRIVGKKCFGGICYPVDQYGRIYFERGGR